VKVVHDNILVFLYFSEYCLFMVILMAGKCKVKCSLEPTNKGNKAKMAKKDKQCCVYYLVELI